MVLNGIPVGGQFLTQSILADVIDYDEFLNGMRNEGSFRWSTLLKSDVKKGREHSKFQDSVAL